MGAFLVSARIMSSGKRPEWGEGGGPSGLDMGMDKASLHSETSACRDATGPPLSQTSPLSPPGLSAAPRLKAARISLAGVQ